MELNKKRLITYLKKKNLYERNVDDILIDELFYNIDLANQSRNDINARGIIVPINKEKTLFNTNPSVNIYNTAVKNILNLSRKIGLSARDRKEIGMSKITQEEGDNF